VVSENKAIVCKFQRIKKAWNCRYYRSARYSRTYSIK